MTQHSSCERDEAWPHGPHRLLSALPRYSVQHGYINRIGLAGIVAKLQTASTLVGRKKGENEIESISIQRKVLIDTVGTSTIPPEK